MKRLFIFILFVFLTIGLLYINPLMADELSLKNGDRISGNILNMSDSQVVIKTSYAGEITVKWTEIANVKSDQKIAVMLKNGIEYIGNIVEAGKGLLKLDSSGKNEASSLSIEEIKMIRTSTVPVVKIKTRANAGLTYTRGNTNKDSSYFDGEFSARTTNNRYTAGGELNRTRDKGVPGLKITHWAFSSMTISFRKGSLSMVTGSLKRTNSRTLTCGLYTAWALVISLLKPR